MKYPPLVPKILCKTKIDVIIYGEGLTEDGEPITEFKGSLLCNYQEGAKTVLTNQKKLVEISGVAYFNGDICPKLGVISDGEVVVHTKQPLLVGTIYPSKEVLPGDTGGITTKRKILKGVKGRNPDGTVNFTKLELI